MVGRRLRPHGIALLDDRDALIVYGMNGEALTAEHGYPARLLTPGLYGFVGATKWLTRLEVTTFAASQAYWTTRGWAAKAPMKPAAKIEVPKASAVVPAGRVTVGGVSWAPRAGVGGVQVRIDDGPWVDARLGPSGGLDYWRQWIWSWDATPGQHRVQARVVDAAGAVQTDQTAPPAPDGASGWHTIAVTVA